jgi:hypothetical protein
MYPPNQAGIYPSTLTGIYPPNLAYTLTMSNYRPVYADPGGKIAASDVFGLDEPVARAWDAIEHGSNLLLDHPRRFGKSTFMGVLVAEPPTGWCARMISVQGWYTTTEFVAALLGCIKDLSGRGKAIADVLNRFFTEAKVGPITLSNAYHDTPLEALSQAFDSLNRQLESNSLRLLLAVDEVSETVREIGRREGAAAARALLGALRRLREQPDSRVQWVMAGSIGFHHVLRELEMTDNVLSVMRRFPLGPLDDISADQLAGGLLEGVGLDQALPEHAATRATMVAATDGIPILLHLIGQQVRDSRTKNFGADLVQSTLDQAFRTKENSGDLTHLLSRIDTFYGTNVDAAFAVLDHTSQQDTKRPTLIGEVPGATNDVIEWLIDDHYLFQLDGGVLTWRYQSLGRLWRIRRGLL